MYVDGASEKTGKGLNRDRGRNIGRNAAGGRAGSGSDGGSNRRGRAGRCPVSGSFGAFSSAGGRLSRLLGVGVVAVCLAVVAADGAGALPGFTETLEVGGDTGWPAFVEQQGVRLRSGRRGNDEVVLARRHLEPTAHSDLLLRALPGEDQGAAVDETRRYRIVSDDTEASEQFRVGDGPGLLFREGGEGIVLEPGRDALFYPGRAWEGFTLSFWLFPVSLDEGEEIVSYHGVRLEGNEPVSQQFRVSVTGGRLQVRFENFFTLPDFERTSVVLRGRQRLLRRQWEHHTIRFSPQTGMIEYLVNGEPVDIDYATETGTEGGTVFVPAVGTESARRLTVGAGFRGALDQFHLSSRFDPVPQLDEYPDEPGTVVTEMFDLGRAGAELKRLEVDKETPNGTDVDIWMRTADLYDDTGNLDAEWERVEAAELDKANAERYVQFRLRLYPDGAGERTPIVRSIGLEHVPRRPPGVPEKLRATPGDGRVELDWDPAPGAQVAGYRVYYGTRPGRYLGETAAEGPSPVDVGDETSAELTGLENSTRYYFVVRAYDDASKPNLSASSDEASARPREIDE